MFGTLRPHRCALSEDARLVHRRLYCGLCQAMGTDYGPLSRALVSHDAVLMGAVVEALSEQQAAPSSCRCPINPTQHRPTFAPDSVPMRFASATQVLLADQWLADKEAEGRLVARTLRPLGRRAVRQASAALSAMGASPEVLSGFEAQQLLVEATAHPSPRQAAAPTARALAAAFSWASQAPHVAPLPSSAQGALADLGAALGETIYGIDALEDLEGDLRAGSFNPCIRDARIDASAVDACAEMLAAAGRRIQAALDAIPWQRDRELLDNILLHQQGTRARAAVAQARTLCRQGVPSLLDRLLLALAAWWAWLRSSLSASSDPAEGDDTSDPERRKRKKRRRKKDGGDDGGRDGGNSSCCDCCGDSLHCCNLPTPRGGRACDIDLPGPCNIDCCPCDGDGCGCDCGGCDCG